MAWQRKIPFGYHMVKGEVQRCPIESEVVKTIYNLYLEGMAYQKIAEEMMRQNIRYHQHTAEWNKHMVKRILENHCYLGTKGYPTIITPESFMQVQIQKNEKNCYVPCSDSIQSLRQKAVCGVCGGRMLRDTRAAGKVRWHCENSDCQNRRYIEDDELQSLLHRRLTALATEPKLIDWSLPKQGSAPTLETLRIHNEVTRELNRTDPNPDYTKMLIFACATEKYSGLTDNTPYHKLKALRERLESQPVDCEELFHIAVNRMEMNADSTITLRLINGNRFEDERKES